MSQLLDFLRGHEEFRSRGRWISLYSDFSNQRVTNPDGFQANTVAWLSALSAAAKSGVLSSDSDGTSSGGDRLVLHSGSELLHSLQTPDLGTPLALGAVLDEAVSKHKFIPRKEFLEAKQSIYSRSWIPSPWDVMKWGLKQVGISPAAANGEKLPKADFVIAKNAEDAAKAVLGHATSLAVSNASRIYSRELFNSTFAPVIGVKSLSGTDLSVLLTHMARDHSAISYSATTGTVRFRLPSETEPSPISEEDVSIASLRTFIASLEPQIANLNARVSECDRVAREAVATKQLTRAKTSLRQKKATESQLQQRTATLAQLEDVYAKIEQAADQVELVRLMEASSKTLKSLNARTGGADRVQDVVDSLREEMGTVDEIGAAINEVSAATVDEGDVEDELEAMEREQRAQTETAERREKETRDAVAKEARDREIELEVETTRQALAQLDQLGTRDHADAESRQAVQE